jgi:hypothetical protein
LIEGERPELEISLSGPVDDLVEHHGASPLGNGANGPFRIPILMVGANAGVVDFLVLVRAILDEIVSGKRGIVSMILLDIEAMFFSESLKGVLSLQSFTDTEGNLVGMMDKLSGMVNE